MIVSTRTLLILVGLLLFSNCISSQIVSVDPPFFVLDESITIIYDASQGNGGLVGVDQVFMHSGIITESGGSGNWQNVQGDWGTFDTKGLMTSLGNDLHQIIINPTEYYNITSDQSVIQLAFVFRNEDGSKEGKTSDLGDIFLDIPSAEGLSGLLLAPAEKHIVKRLGDQLLIKLTFNEDAYVEIYDNNFVLYEGTSRNVEYLINITQSGDHVVDYSATFENDEFSGSFSYVVLEDNVNILDPPTALSLGFNRVDGNSAYLALFAPMKEYVFAIGNFGDWNLSTQYQMNLSSDESIWWVELSNLDPNEIYTYQFIMDNKLKIADPFSSLVLDEFNDESIPGYLNSVILDYPKSETNGQVSVFSTAPNDFNWEHDEFEVAEVKDLIIYELMMRDFLEDHSFKSLLDTLSYLDRLGVNSIELMPISEFEGNQSWGYNPSFQMALDKYYGSPEDFKKFVDKAHSMDIAIILDVVYNHSFGQSPLVRMYWDAINNRPSEDSPYFNPIAKHPYNVGYDFNHESQATKQFVKQTITYWIEEFHVDGFRFDLSKGFTQKQSSSDGAFSAKDDTRIEILKDYGDYIWNVDEDQILILEHFASNEEELILSDYGFLLWGNANYNFNEATMGYTEDRKSDFGHIFYEERGWDLPHLIGYMESHDEERLMYKNLEFGNASGFYDIQNPTIAYNRMKMAVAFFMSIPGPKMLWQFGELGYEFSINRCEDGTISENCRLSPKPIKWDYQENPDRMKLYDVFSEMAALKTSHPAITSGSVSLSTSDALKRISLSHEDGNIIVLGNFGVEPGSIQAYFQHTGRWHNYLTNDFRDVTDPTISINLDPGDFKVYVDDISWLITKTIDRPVQSDIIVFPNPSNRLIEISFKNYISNEYFQIKLLDIHGRVHHTDYSNIPYSLSLDVDDGIYILELSNEEKMYTTKIIIQK